MSHPRNRLERFVIGDTKGKKRGYRYWNGFYFEKDPKEREERLLMASRKRRNTTKLCSCIMCGNKRRIYGLSLQERKHNESLLELD